MKRDMASIEFESKAEVETVLNVLSAYMEQHPAENDEPAVRQLYEYLDVMDMSW